MLGLRHAKSLLTLLAGVLLAGCGSAPDDAAVREVLQQRLTAALKPPVAEVTSFRCLGSGPLPAASSNLATVADLKGKRVDLGLPGSGTRANAEAVLAASRVGLSDLAEVKEAGLVEGLRLLNAGDVDAVITTLAAPAYTLQAAAAGQGIKLLAIGPQERTILAGAHSDMVPVTLPPNTYPGQTETVYTVAVTALLVATAEMPDSTVETVMGELFGGIDFIAASSTAGSLISNKRAHGITSPHALPCGAKRFASSSRPAYYLHPETSHGSTRALPVCSHSAPNPRRSGYRPCQPPSSTAAPSTACPALLPVRARSRTGMRIYRGSACAC
jgi:hypothetical protein